MKTQEIVVNGKKETIVVELDDEYKDDSILYNNLEDTMDLSKTIENTMKIDTGDIHD